MDIVFLSTITGEMHYPVSETIKNLLQWRAYSQMEDMRAATGLVPRRKRQLMSDVPLGSFLSGGMDTGSIAAAASKENPGMHTFTCGFDL